MNPTGRVVICGGTGFLGQNLCRHLRAAGRDVVVIGRNRPRGELSAPFVGWDGHGLGEWVQQLDGAAAVVNLAGRSVDCIKTPDHQDEILRSRVEATRAIGLAVRAVANPPPVWVQMSTAHIHGDPPERRCDEHAPYGTGLAPFVGRAWEDEHANGLLPGMRSVVLRTSFVLGRTGGALPRLSLLVRALLGGKAGHGRQGISWIHERDLDLLMQRAIDDPTMHGVYLATAPTPVSNAEFMRELRRAMRVPFGLPAMAWMVRIGAPLLLRTDPELALYGRYCVSRRLREQGYEWAFPDLPSALRDLFAR